MRITSGNTFVNPTKLESHGKQTEQTPQLKR